MLFDINKKIQKIKSAVSSFYNDERGSELPVTAILATLLATCALGAGIYIMGKVKTSIDGTGQTIDDAGSETYS